MEKCLKTIQLSTLYYFLLLNIIYLHPSYDILFYSIFTSNPSVSYSSPLFPLISFKIMDKNSNSLEERLQ